MPDLLIELYFLYQRLNWLSILDIFLVASVFYAILVLVRDTQAVVLLRGAILLILILLFITSLAALPAFSWLVRTILPALIFSIPVIFAPEIRRALERLGRAGTGTPLWRISYPEIEAMQNAIKSVVSAAARLSARQHGALIVLQRNDRLSEYAQTGVRMDANVTPELLLQIFYPNTPLHDGAVIIAEGHVIAAACVMPLSSSGILNRSPDRQMGLRHRAALGISEASDAVAVVVSEETGSISVAQSGRLIRRLDTERLENILMAFYQPEEVGAVGFFRKVQRWANGRRRED